GEGGAAVPHPAPLHLVVRTRPHGPARRHGTGVPARRLDRRGVHRRLPVPRLRLPPHLTRAALPGRYVCAESSTSPAMRRSVGWCFMTRRGTGPPLWCAWTCCCSRTSTFVCSGRTVS